jgi:very-short-patch-repair endonuclease
MDKRKNESWNTYNKKTQHLACWRKWSRPSRLTGKIIKCEHCWKEVYKNKSSLEKSDNLFCSLKCANKYQWRNKDKYTCKICWKYFEWSPSRKKDHAPKYCWIECRNKCEVWKLNSVIKWNLIQQNMKWPNKLELAGRKILQDLWIEFEEQVLMFEKFCVDVYVKSKNTVIQRDWIYRHSKPKRKQLDKSQDAYMKKCWVKVLRFTDNDIYNLTDDVYENIKRTIW